MYEAFTLFETIHGDLQTLADATTKISNEQKKVARRREKAAQQQAQAYYEAVPAQSGQEIAPTTEKVEAAAPQNEAPQTEDSHFKRYVGHLCLFLSDPRDRENTTVLVTGLSAGTDKTALETFFANVCTPSRSSANAQCGHIREIAVLSDDDSISALVEFKYVDAVPRALELDQQKLNKAKVHISMLWRSTLFVTNFPRETDDAAMRQMFSQVSAVSQSCPMTNVSMGRYCKLAGQLANLQIPDDSAT